jgi:hypothetical protein
MVGLRSEGNGRHENLPILTAEQAQAFFEGLEKDEDGNIILHFSSEED